MSLECRRALPGETGADGLVLVSIERAKIAVIK